MFKNVAYYHLQFTNSFTDFVNWHEIIKVHLIS